MWCPGAVPAAGIDNYVERVRQFRRGASHDRERRARSLGVGHWPRWIPGWHGSCSP